MRKYRKNSISKNICSMDEEIEQLNNIFEKWNYYVKHKISSEYPTEEAVYIFTNFPQLRSLIKLDCTIDKSQYYPVLAQKQDTIEPKTNALREIKTILCRANEPNHPLYKQILCIIDEIGIE